MTDQREPCGNEECDLCDPRPRFKISVERVQRLVHERTIKAATAEEALRIYDEGTEWPSSYDDRGGEILERHSPVVVIDEPHSERMLERLCWHNLPSRDELAFAGLSSCDFVGDQGCTDPGCERCHPSLP